MGETTTEGASVGAGIDLSQFYQVFFEEAGENLDTMEQMLLELDIDARRRRGAERDLPLRALGQGRRRDVRLRRRGRADAPDGDAARQAAPPRAGADRGDGRRAAGVGRCAAARSSRATRAAAATPVDTAELLADIRALRRRRRRRAARRRGRRRAGRGRRRGAGRRRRAAQPADARQLELHRRPARRPDAWPTTWSSCSRRSPTSARSSRSTPASAADGMRRFKVVTTQQRQRPAGPVHLPRRRASRCGCCRSARATASTPARPARPTPSDDADPGYGFFDDAPGAPASARRSAAGAAAPRPTPSAARPPRRAARRGRQAAPPRRSNRRRCASRSRRSTS